MKQDSDLFTEFIIKSILKKNEFQIISVQGIETVKSIFFINDEYNIIKDLMRNGNIEAINVFPESQPNTGEYLDILLFKDQQGKKYIVSVYDNNELEQDPRIIELFPL